MNDKRRHIQREASGSFVVGVLLNVQFSWSLHMYTVHVARVSQQHIGRASKNSKQLLANMKDEQSTRNRNQRFKRVRTKCIAFD